MEEEKPEYFYRLIRLVVDVGTKVLLNVFKSKTGPSIKKFLKSKENEIDRLKKRKVFNSMQLELLKQTNIDENKLDISLLYTLLRNLTDISAPNNGWDGCLLPYDMSPGACLKRLKDVRNEAIAHRAKGSLVKSEFDKFWNEASKNLVELAGAISTDEELAVEQKVKEVKDQPLLGDEEHKIDALLKWEFEDRCSVLESKLDALNDKVDQQGRVTEEMKSSLGVIKDYMKELGIGGTSLLVEQGPSTSFGREQDIPAGQMKAIIEQMQRKLNQFISQKTWYVVVRQTVMMGEENDLDPINNPNALTDDEIRKYSSELGIEWETFAIWLGYKQKQIDQLKITYPHQIRTLLRAMIQKWHDVVARCGENPKELLAAAFIKIHDEMTAKKILGNSSEALKEVKKLIEAKKLKPKDETANRIHDIAFDLSAKNTYTISITSDSSGQTHTRGIEDEMDGNNSSLQED